MTRYRHKNYSNHLPISRQRRNATASPTGILAAMATVNDAPHKLQRRFKQKMPNP